MKKGFGVAMVLLLLLGNSTWGIQAWENSAWAQDIKATTDSGRAVILKDDGTWSFARTSSTALAPSGPHQKPASATQLVRSRRGGFGIWLDNSKWRIQKTRQNADTQFEFRHRKGQAYAMVIAERISMSLEALKTVAIKNVKSVGKNVRVLSEERRVVNGNEVLMLKISAVIQTLRFVYLNYYYVGKFGSIQVVTYTSKNLFDEYEADLIDLLNGFVLLNPGDKTLDKTAAADGPEQSPGIADPDGKYTTPANATSLVRSKRGDFGIWLDASKWSSEKVRQNADAMFEFQHRNRDAYAMVIAEKEKMSLKTLKRIAIQNVEAVGKKVRVVSEEKRLINGNEVLMLKISAVIQSIPFIYYNYYYTGKIGSIQFITYTGANLFEEYKADFEDLLNGFVILNKGM